MAGEVGGFDVEPVLTRKAEHILTVDVPSDTIGVRLL